ncbi:hypothetical protein [Streptomyces cyslabdanicus]|uniref:hypothetical protein n=1 Tax=Streptomyces cyslabdanicus TaxID=1470456 RepID=UPI004043C3C4
MAGTPAANAVEGRAPDVRWAQSVSDDLGTLAVSVSSDSAIKEIRAHIVSDTTDQEVAVVENDAFVLVSGTPDDGVWHTKQPLDLADLGSYTVRIEATDSDGDRTTDNSAGRLVYYVAAVFEDVHTDRTEVDIDHRQVRVEGILKGRWPATRELKPLADHGVDLDVDYWTENTVRTDAEGRFSGTVTVNDAVPVQAVCDPFIASASANSVQITVLRASVFTSFSATRAPSHGVHVEGAMDFPDGWTPATIPVHIQYSRNGKQWTDLLTAEAYWHGSGHTFSADFPEVKNGYFRAHFEATESFRAATSETVKASN